jgi:hypothetical protein
MPGWPFRSLRVTGAMVVFTSGIVDAHACPACWAVSWLLVASRWWGMGSSALLGPEESAVRLLLFHGWGGGVGCSGPPFVCSLCVLCWLGWGVWVLVGLLFEICIVDASIYSSMP